MSTLIDFSAPDSTETVVSGLTCDWYAQQQIVSYTVSSADEGIMSAWGNRVTEVLKGWDVNKPYLALHDLSMPGVAVFYMVYPSYKVLNFAVSPQNMTQARAILNTHQHPARVAVVLSMSLSGRTAHQTIDVNDSDSSNVLYESFFQREKALEWLAEGLVTA